MADPVMRSGVVFDIDDTLFLETDYVRSGFRAVSRLLAGTGAVTEEEAYEFLERGFFEQGVRDRAFDRLLEAMPQVMPAVGVPQMVQVYRGHEPEIGYLPGMRELLETLRSRNARLAVISDGALASQEGKVRALGLEELVDLCVLTDRWGRDFWKPSPRAFEHVAGEWKTPPDRTVYVGDNPAKDFVAPNRLGWRTIRLRLPGQLRAESEAPTAEHEPGLTVSSVQDLGEALRSWL